MINLSLDLYQIKGHAQDYMRSFGIAYEQATPQTIADCWWFWNCSNVPDPLPPALKILEMTPSEAVGYGLSRADADRLEYCATTTEHAMNIEEAKIAKAELEATIAAVLQQFSAKTGTTVTCVDTDALPRFGASPTYVVQVEVRL